MAFRLLIVDDSAAMRSLIRRIGSMSGLEVVEYLEAENGEEALQVLSREWVDVVLTDINMPRMNGEELVARLEKDEVLRSIPVLVISTDSTPGRMERLISLGAKGYLRKPFTPFDLRAELERVLGVANAY
jgi:two-component system chemotaxis response regulator CheY